MARKNSSKKANNPTVSDRLIILGILIFTLGTLSNFQIFYNSLRTVQEAPVEVLVGQFPSDIEISSLNLKAKIIQGGFINGEWILSDDKALYLPTSGKIGEGFNTILYAHNKSNLFGSLKAINEGDLITIKDNKGKQFSYKVFSKENVDSKDLRKLYSDEKDIITLFTCDGWFDQERLLVKARLVEN